MVELRLLVRPDRLDAYRDPLTIASATLAQALKSIRHVNHTFR
jgi:hypothetical protein